MSVGEMAADAEKQMTKTVEKKTIHYHFMFQLFRKVWGLLIENHLADRPLAYRPLDNRPLVNIPLAKRPLAKRHMADRHLANSH